MTNPANVFADLPKDLPNELITTLLEAADVRIERIISYGHASPPRLLVRPAAARVGDRVKGGGEVAVRGWHGRDEGGRLHQYPGFQKAPGRLDNAGRADCVAGSAVRRGDLMRPQPLICVRDVEASSRWYQRLLNCQSDHGGTNYERLVHSGRLVMQLHCWEVEHHHGCIGDPDDMPPGNGLLLWFEIDDIDAAIARAEALGAEVIMPRHRNPPDGDGGPNHWEIWLRDLDGYKVVLASPDGTADGEWRP